MQYGNNPVNRIDPDGRDWIVAYGTINYQWRDDIDAKSKMPEGYTYVGANDTDILTHMGVSSHYETKTDVAGGVGFVGGGDKNVGPLGQGIPGGSIARVKANISISANVSFNADNATEYNKAGKTFDGVGITANVFEQTVSSSPDLQSNSGSYLSVTIGDKEYTSGLKTPTGEYIYETGSKPTTATVNISANKLSNTSYLQSATVRIGRPNAGLLINIPTKISWNLQTIQMFRPAK